MPLDVSYALFDSYDDLISSPPLSECTCDQVFRRDKSQYDFEKYLIRLVETGHDRAPTVILQKVMRSTEGEPFKERVIAPRKVLRLCNPYLVTHIFG
jgi:hypothetical protein